MPIANPYNASCPSQAILALIGSKWSMLILCSLRAAPARTNELKRRLGGVSAKMLTQTLRDLERHGIVERLDLRTVPPHVEYQLSPLGRSLSELIIGIENWVVTHYAQLTGRAGRIAENSVARLP